MNQEADYQSRVFTDGSNWRINLQCYVYFVAVLCVFSSYYVVNKFRATHSFSFFSASFRLAVLAILAMRHHCTVLRKQTPQPTRQPNQLASGSLACADTSTSGDPMRYVGLRPLPGQPSPPSQANDMEGTTVEAALHSWHACAGCYACTRSHGACLSPGPSHAWSPTLPPRCWPRCHCHRS